MLFGILATLVIVFGAFVFLGLVLFFKLWQAAGELIYPGRRRALSTPSDYGLTAESLSFVTRDGLTLRGWFVPAPPPVKGTVVFSHGYAGDCSPDLVYIPWLNRSGYNVFAFDYRGHGESDGNYTSLVHFERGDLLAALECLRTRGIERVGLIGFSMGGAIALATAPHSPMVVGVISDSTFGELNRIVGNVAIDRGAPRWLANLIGWLVEVMAGLRLRANLFLADPIHWVNRIAPRPVLIMHGDADEAIPVTEAYRLYDAACEPKQLWIVPGANHRKLEDIAPQEYRRRIIEFFDRAFETSSPIPS